MTTPFPELVRGEKLLLPEDALLLRNVHPQFFDQAAGIVSSQAFRPNSSDAGQMSVAQDSLISPMNCYVEYTVIFERLSAGVWALTTQEVSDIGARSVDDRDTQTVTGAPLPTGHAYIDFRDLGGSANREGKRARKLKACALARGCLYLSPS